MIAIKDKLLSMFKDKFAEEQCMLAKSLCLTNLKNDEIQGKVEKYELLTPFILQHNTYLCDVLPMVYKDIEFYETIFHKIHQCSLVGGGMLSKLVHSTPIASTEMLSERTNLLSTLESLYLQNIQSVEEHLTNLAKKEKYILWMYDDHDTNLQDLYNIVYFNWKGIKQLNRYGGALTTYNLYRILISPLVGIFSPIIYFIIPYLIIVFKFKLKVSFTFYIKTLVAGMLSIDSVMGQSKFFSYVRIASYLFSAVFYFQSIFSSIDVSTTCNRISNLLIENLNHVISYIDSAKYIIDIFWQDGFNTYFDVSLLPTIDPFIHSLEPHTYSIFSNFGNQLKNYKVLKEQKLPSITTLVRKTYMIDCLLGSIKYKISRGFCYCSIDKSSKPMIQINGLCHPCIDTDKAIPNSIAFADSLEGRNAIITSPNSSGKSVLIKSIITNVLMAQSIGVCCATQCSLTPFGFINTQINVPDSTGFESLFEAEMHRCKHNLDKLAKNKHEGFSLIIMDEIFSSTNPVEAVAGAFAVCKKMASYDNNILIFTTHFNYLTKLAKNPEHSFVNYRMGIHHNELTNDIQFTYRIEKGVNKHLLALELLKKSGFDNDILDDAINIKKLLLKK
jgi:archaellum biogenesis ATPase FlaH